MIPNIGMFRNLSRKVFSNYLYFFKILNQDVFYIHKPYLKITNISRC